MKTDQLTLMEPLFDWYQGTAKTEPRELLEVLESLAQESAYQTEKPKLKGYAFAKKVGGTGGSCLIHYGGRNGDDYGPNFAGTGPMAIQVAELVRSANLVHSVSRVDVRQDALADFSCWRAAFIERCNKANMEAMDAGSCPESIKQLGRTVYGGSKTSAYRPTIYEKGLQLGEDYPKNYLRLEHRFMLSKAHEKSILSMLTPTEIVGLRPVSRDLSQTLAGLAAAPYKLTKLPKSADAYTWMLKQYGGALREMHMDHGSWEAVGSQIGLDLQLLEESDYASR